MSYILDALRRADADRERERGAVPGLHAQPLGSVAAPVGAGRAPAVVAAASLAGLVLVAALGWALWRGQAGPVTLANVPPATAVDAPSTRPSAAPAVAPSPSITVAAAPAAPASVAAPTVVPPVSRPAAPPVPAATARVPAAAPPPARATVPAPSADAARSAIAPAASRRTGDAPAVAPAPGSAAPASDTRVPTLAELPESVRRELPTLTIGGAMHSPHASSRMLIVNGQVFHEGEKVAPELWLEQIKLKDAVLRYKTHRYSVSF